MRSRNPKFVVTFISAQHGECANLPPPLLHPLANTSIEIALVICSLQIRDGPNQQQCPDPPLCIALTDTDCTGAMGTDLFHDVYGQFLDAAPKRRLFRCFQSSRLSWVGPLGFAMDLQYGANNQGYISISTINAAMRKSHKTMRENFRCTWEEASDAKATAAGFLSEREVAARDNAWADANWREELADYLEEEEIELDHNREGGYESDLDGGGDDDADDKPEAYELGVPMSDGHSLCGSLCSLA